MKIADKIKAAIALNPEIAENRTQLRAMYYLHKTSHHDHHFRIVNTNNTTTISLYYNGITVDGRCLGQEQVGEVKMNPLSAYHLDTAVELAEEGVSGIAGVALDVVKKVFNDLKL